MYAARYFAPRYFAPRYWPNVGAEAEEGAELVILDLPWRVDEAVFSLYWSVDTTLSLTWRPGPMAYRLDFPEFSAGEAVRINAAPVSTTDITGWTLRFRVRTGKAGTVLLTLTLGSGITLTAALLGTFAVALTAAQTTALRPGRHWFDLWRTDSGSETELAEGFMPIRA